MKRFPRKPGWLRNFWPFGDTLFTRRKYTSKKRRYPLKFESSKHSTSGMRARIRRGFAGKSPGRLLKANNRMTRVADMSYRHGASSEKRRILRRQQAAWRKYRGRPPKKD